MKTDKGLEQKAKMCNKSRLSTVFSFIRSIADQINGALMRCEFQKIILPFTVRRRLDYALERTKDKVFATEAQLKTQALGNRHGQLCRRSGQALCSTDKFTFKATLSGDGNLARSLKRYLLDFSKRPHETLDAFKETDTTLRGR